MHTRRGAYRGKKQMNKFAFQNNARQSHLPASLAAHLSLSLPLPSRPFGLRYLLHRAVGHHVPRCIRLHPHVHPPPPTTTSYGLHTRRLTTVDAPWHPLLLRSTHRYPRNPTTLLFSFRPINWSGFKFPRPSEPRLHLFLLRLILRLCLLLLPPLLYTYMHTL